MQLTTETIDLHLRHTFTIARGSRDVQPVVVIRVAHDGITGTGETSPSQFYGETAETVIEALDGLRPWLETQSPEAYTHFLEEASERLGKHRAALCALDLAIHDWIGQSLGQPLYRIFGLDLARIPKTSFTIGIDTPERMIEKIREAADFPVIKIKLGTPQDIDIVRALRAETNAVFRVDANCGWTAAETIEKSHELAALGVEFIEQPLPPDELDSMAEVFANSALPVVADENAVTPESVPALRERFHGINIKLVKCGGIQPALRMVHLARTFGMQVMYGCMIDTSVCASAAAHIGALADWLDLDGPLLVTDDPFEGLDYPDGRPLPSDRPGLGVRRR